jgi:ELWxxDGT repeat protein
VSGLPGRATLPAVTSRGVFFAVSENQLWLTNGTEAGTAHVRTFPEPIYSLTGMGGQVFFSAKDTGTSYALWRSNGTDTVLVKEVSPSTSDGPHDLISTGSQLYFNENHPDTGTELWTSNGFGESTHLTRDVHPGAGSSFPFFHTRLDDWRIVFFANAAENAERGLWVSNGSEWDTRQLLKVSPATQNRPVRVGTRVCFAGQVEQNPAALVCTDGTEKGTAVVRPDLTGVDGLGVVNDSLLFWAGGQLWTSGGTDDTTRVLTQGDNSLPSSAYHLKGDLLLFDTGTLQTGWELHALKLDQPLPTPPIPWPDEPSGCGGCASSDSRAGNAVAPLAALTVLLLLARRRAHP